jgi:hypothetical protein
MLFLIEWPFQKVRLLSLIEGETRRTSGWRMAGSFIQAVTFLLEGQLRFIMAPLNRDGILRDIIIDWSVIWLKPDLSLVVFSSRR